MTTSKSVDALVPSAAREMRRRRAQVAMARTLASQRAAALARRDEEVERLVTQRKERFAGCTDARERALMSLYADNLLTEGDIRQITGWSHWDFLAMLGRYQDLVPPGGDYYAALGALERR